jgi:hypothetical protein
MLRGVLTSASLDDDGTYSVTIAGPHWSLRIERIGEADVMGLPLGGTVEVDSPDADSLPTIHHEAAA